MSKLFYFMALVALVAVLACGGEDATYRCANVRTRADGCSGANQHP